jgi:hypothetical protein
VKPVIKNLSSPQRDVSENVLKDRTKPSRKTFKSVNPHYKDAGNKVAQMIPSQEGPKALDIFNSSRESNEIRIVSCTSREGEKKGNKSFLSMVVPRSSYNQNLSPIVRRASLN